MALDNILNSFSIVLTVLLCLILIPKTASHVEMYLSDGDVCKLDFDVAGIKLKSGESSSVVVKSGNYFSSFTGRYDFNCKFVIKTKEKYGFDEGIYAVIQDLNFRTDDDGECMDYVQFSLPPKDISKFLGRKPRGVKRFCGNLGPGKWLDSHELDDSEEIDLYDRKLAPNAYISTEDQLGVEIYVSRERLLPGQKLVVTLAFTAFKKDCFDNKFSLMQCRIGECINSSLRGDKIQNCPYISCADEGGCRSFPRDDEDGPYKEMDGSGIGTKVTFGAVAAIIIILLKFALCLWVCKRIHRRRAAPPQPSRQAAVPAQPRGEVCIPTAPPAQPEIEIQDMPPPYDSLFPPKSRESET